MNMGAYLIKTALCLTCFYLTYRVLLNKRGNYTVNRFYLIGSFLLSFVFPLIKINLPLITIPVVSTVENPFTEKIDPLLSDNVQMVPDSAVAEADSWTNPFFIISIIYLAGILVFLIRYGLDIFRLVRLIHKNRKQKFSRYTLVNVDNPVAPFSFFRYVFVYFKDVASDDFQRFILKHELAHIRNWHSLDRLFIGLGQIVQWFNPVILFYRKAVITLHEFSADHAVIENSASLRGYQQKILQYSYEKNNIMLTSSLSNTMIKKRFIMMTKSNPGRHSTYRVIAATVVAAFLLLAFSNGDKVSVISKSDKNSLASSMAATDDKDFSHNIPLKDTIRNSDANQYDSRTLKLEQEDEEIARLNDELIEMKREHQSDSIFRMPRNDSLMDREELKRNIAERQRHIVERQRHMAEMQRIIAERQRHFAEKQRQFAEQQRMLAERLKPIMEGQPCLPDAGHLKEIIENQARIEQFRPMIEEYLKNNPPLEPFLFDEPCPRLEELQPFIEDHLKDLQFRHHDRLENLRSLDEKDMKLLEEQKEWREKYRKEMEKQRDQMEDKREQLLEEYQQMMKKYMSGDE